LYEREKERDGERVRERERETIQFTNGSVWVAKTVH
jgi:hypothetical protein